MMEPTFILTAEMDGESFAWLDALRRRHFPPERNMLPAHLTMFHRLSPAQLAALRSLDMPRSPVPLCFDRVVFLGFGVALHVQSDELERLRKGARASLGELSRQDSQPWRPHVTIQNKAPAETARHLHQTLQDGFTERAGAATGLLIWEYLGGPWRLAERIAFGDGFQLSPRS
ncbi:2'-5' RNA ligase family protein [Bradyrhizobium diazoefficiens]|jgi:hypothetical protein|nr:2'-5' RNA ligase family protein [Bradyrhizobium diazoefficiens]UCF54969.1 MAG: 2'-5' RNA ligase family protein [Bradyrhizobium sp.]MBR0968671.1 2'-5' RNA ligase family protein [Bradyrhizobium diazoefficiens]MBR0981938.1 2'-5' RNA ligase family protein [Bradyrhizobium diazoefficiens]MBR1011445.1 2'-5' RNA ligase family protein [Bradyrhizobium diazoefficiens]MBR1017870.1 2'-5' RNA ligase family protein [Bradyrhizobium diazoefficiens]